MIAGGSTHPLDLIKVRMQLQGEAACASGSAPALAGIAQIGRGGLAVSTMAQPITMPVWTPKENTILSTGLRISRDEGASALYKGVSATLLRQGIYSSVRFGVYDIIKKSIAPVDHGGKASPLPLYLKVLAGMASGAVGAAVGNPADLAMVRMQADGRLPVMERRNYRNCFHAIRQIVSSEGVATLWRGCGPTVNRAMIVTASQLATYDQAKELLIGRRWMEDGVSAHIAASMAAGVTASVASNPVDVIKTRLMNMKPVDGKLPYVGTWDCATKMVRQEGLMSLYKGFIPTVARQGPFVVILFVTLEQLKLVFN
eukprot:jgi/Mesvir1/2753/Mv14370-RA.1